MIRDNCSYAVPGTPVGNIVQSLPFALGFAAIRMVPFTGNPLTGFSHSPRSVTPFGIYKVAVNRSFPSGTNRTPPLGVPSFFLPLLLVLEPSESNKVWNNLV